MTRSEKSRGAAPGRTLVIGYGNPARGDDGLGPALADRVERMKLPGVTVEADYQLSIEHAALVAEHDLVVFADAATDGDEPVYLRRLCPADDAAACTSHALTATQVLSLARSCFGATPDAFVVGMRAHVLGEFKEGLSPEADATLDLALVRVVDVIRTQGRRGPSTAPGRRADPDGSETE